MTKDRQIVLMLILRKIQAHRNWLRAKEKYGTGFFEERMNAAWCEAHNAAELARRILYKEE